MLILAYALVGCAHVGRTYYIPLLIAAILFIAYILLARRLNGGEHLCRRIGAVKTCALITLLCLAVNLPVVFLVRLTPSGDFSMFWWIANDLAAGVDTGWSDYAALFPHILGYSTFLSWFLSIFGSSTLVAALLNVVMTAVSGVIIFRLVLRWRDIEAASFACLLWALCPSKMLYNTMVLSEPLYTMLLLLFILILSELERHADGIRQPVLWGAAAGAVCAVVLRAVNASRPVAAIPIIAFFIWVLLLRGAELREKKKWLLYGGFALMLLALYFPLGALWDAHVADVVGEEPAGLPAYSMYVGFNPDTNGEYSSEDSLLLDAFCASERSAVGAQARMLEALKERLASGELNFAKLFITKLSTFLGFDDGGAYYMRAGLSGAAYPVLAVCCNIFYYALLMLAILGSARLFREANTSCTLLLPLYVLGLTMAHMLVEVAARYHYSAIPMLVMLAAFGCDSPLLKKR